MRLRQNFCDWDTTKRNKEEEISKKEENTTKTSETISFVVEGKKENQREYERTQEKEKKQRK